MQVLIPKLLESVKYDDFFCKLRVYAYLNMQFQDSPL